MRRKPLPSAHGGGAGLGMVRAGDQRMVSQDRYAACKLCGGIDRDTVAVCPCGHARAHWSCFARWQELVLGMLLACRPNPPSVRACESCGEPLELCATRPRLPLTRVWWLVVWGLECALLQAGAMLHLRSLRRTVRRSLVHAIFCQADVDASEALDVEELVALARRTGDVTGADAVPHVVRLLAPRGEDVVHEAGLLELYEGLWPQDMLWRDAQTLGVTTGDGHRWELDDAWARSAVPSSVLWWPLWASAIIVALHGYFSLRRSLSMLLLGWLHRSKQWLFGGGPATPERWADILSFARPRVPTCLGSLALAATFPWAVGDAWVRWLMWREFGSLAVGSVSACARSSLGALALATLLEDVFLQGGLQAWRTSDPWDGRVAPAAR